MRGIGLCGMTVAGLLLAAACSSGGTPSGFVRVRGVKLSAARPSGWQAGSPTAKIMTATAASPAADAEVDLMENFLAGDSKGSEDMLVDTVETGPQMNSTGYHRTGTKSIDVDGAKAAVRVDYTFNDAKKGPCQAVDVGILGKNEQIHAVRVIWQRGKLSKKTVDGIVGSIKAS
ncbi:MAG: hypothetical protein ACRDP6_20840 [Actinoallomurus sp.]